MTKGPIIIVDDDDDDHYIFKRVCEKLQIPNALVFFSDAHKFIDYMRTSPDRPFMILCDVNMPVTNGLELKRIIDSDAGIKKKAVPFVFFSTSAMSSIVKQAFDLSVQGFFIKAQSLEDLENTIKVIFQYWEKCEYPRSAD